MKHAIVNQYCYLTGHDVLDLLNKGVHSLVYSTSENPKLHITPDSILRII